jgi:hypothetical protein
MTLVKWIELLLAVTSIDILRYVPRFLDKLLSIIDHISKIHNTKKYHYLYYNIIIVK